MNVIEDAFSGVWSNGILHTLLIYLIGRQLGKDIHLSDYYIHRKKETTWRKHKKIMKKFPRHEISYLL